MIAWSTVCERMLMAKFSENKTHLIGNRYTRTVATLSQVERLLTELGIYRYIGIPSLTGEIPEPSVTQLRTRHRSHDLAERLTKNGPRQDINKQMRSVRGSRNTRARDNLWMTRIVEERTRKGRLVRVSIIVHVDGGEEI